MADTESARLTGAGMFLRSRFGTFAPKWYDFGPPSCGTKVTFST